MKRATKKAPKLNVPVQLKLFEPTICKEVLLVAESPKNAFYRLRLEVSIDGYMIRKESGSGENVLDRRKWPFKSRKIAEKEFDRKIKAKTDPDRKSPRKYRIKETVEG